MKVNMNEIGRVKLIAANVRIDTNGPMQYWARIPTLFINVISVERAPLTSFVAISPVYMGATVYTMPYPRPENIRATDSTGTELATMTNTQPRMKGIAPRRRVVFLPKRSAK